MHLKGMLKVLNFNQETRILALDIRQQILDDGHDQLFNSLRIRFS